MSGSLMESLFTLRPPLVPSPPIQTSKRQNQNRSLAPVFSTTPLRRLPSLVEARAAAADPRRDLPAADDGRRRRDGQGRLWLDGWRMSNQTRRALKRPLHSSHVALGHGRVRSVGRSVTVASGGNEEPFVRPSVHRRPRRDPL